MNLAFLAPALLAGLAAMTVPVVIHLISKRRARRVSFALMELLLRSQRKTARSIRLRQLLLLLVRTLFVAALALAIARPFLEETQAARTTQAPLAVIVVVDGSASMQAKHSGRSLFEHARRAALDVVRSEATDVRTGALACGTAKEAGTVELAAPTFERARVVEALEKLAPGAFSSSLPACLDRATAMARGVAGDGARRVLVFSDLAAHAFSGARATGKGGGVEVEWRAASRDAVPNHAVLDAAVERLATRAGAALSVPFEAASYGRAGDVEADLILAGARVARVTLPLGDGRPVERRFTSALDGTQAPAADGPGSAHGGATAVVSMPADALALDNEVMLPVDAAGALDVLVVDGAPQALRFQDEVFYLESALEAVRGGRARLRTTSISAEQVTRAHIASARVIVLANVARIDDDAAAALLEHVQAGAGLFVTVGDQVDVAWANEKLGALLPAPLRGSKGQALLDDASVAEVLSLTRFAADHPLFGALAGSDGAEALDVPGLARVRTHTFMLVEPRADPSSHVLARFSNGAPALMERAAGAGRTVVMLTSVDRDWSDLAIRPGFVPLMQQAVLYLGGALEDTGPRAVRVGEPRSLRAPTGATELVVEKPSGARVTLPLTDAARSARFADTDEVGLYGVYSRGDGGDLRARPGERFTVLIAERESDLRRAPAAMLTTAVPDGAVARTTGEADGGVKLWPFLLAFAAMLLLAEAAILRKTLL